MNKLFESGIIKTLPQKWTRESEEEILRLRGSGMSSSEIAERVGRSQVSVSIKLKRLNKTNDTYNKKHRDDKYLYNEKFLEYIKPKNILDVYAGNSFYKDKKDKISVVTNDVDGGFLCDYQQDAFDLLCELRKDRFDIIDLDPYGSASDVFPLALKMAKKGIVITLGEMGHKRWNRLDFVSKWYGISTLEDFTTENIIKELQRIGHRYKKDLKVVFCRDYNRISRVWFEIDKYKTTEQWNKNKQL